VDVILTALAELAEPLRLAMLLAGVCIGLVIGVIPGLGGLFGLALLIPMTYGTDAYSAIALLLGMASVTATSDTIPAVLIGVPGTVGSMATVIDGHALARRNEAGRALGAAYSASLIGGVFGAVVLAVSLPLLRPIVLQMRMPDFLAIALLGLSLVALLVGRDPLRGLAAACLGLAVSFVGVDDRTAAHRWTFDLVYFWEGVPLGAVFLGLFGLPEIATMLSRQAIGDPARAAGPGMVAGMRDTLREWRLVLACSGIGAAIGALPGLGLSVVSWIAYGYASRRPGDGPPFGEGNIRGVIGPESANNANEGGSLIPTIALGIPGGAGTAMLLGALIVHGVVPGPHMLDRDAAVTVAMVFSLALANVIGAGICLALSNPLSRLALVPSWTIAPIALVFVVLGGYQSTASVGDIAVLLAFGTLGMAMKARDWPRPAFALGFVLGDVIERYFFLSWQISGAAGMLRPSMIAVAAIIAFQLVRRLRGRRGVAGPDAAPRRGDRLEAVLALAFAIWLLVTAAQLPSAAALFPTITAIVMVTVTTSMLLRAARRKAAPATGVPALLASDLLVVGGVLSLLAGLYLIGAVATAGLFVAAAMRFGGRQPTVRALITGAAVALVVALVFDTMVSTPWPKTLIGSWLALAV